MRTRPGVLMIAAMRAPVLGIASAAALAAAPAALAIDATGEVVFRLRGSMASSASFDDERVVGPVVNMTRVADEEWAGDVNGADVALHVDGRHIEGASFTLDYAREGEHVSVEGLVNGIRMRVSMDAKRMRGRYGVCSIDMKRKRVGLYEGDVGCLRGGSFPASAKASLELYGVAATPEAPQPQLALALVAVLPR